MIIRLEANGEPCLDDAASDFEEKLSLDVPLPEQSCRSKNHNLLTDITDDVPAFVIDLFLERQTILNSQITQCSEILMLDIHRVLRQPLTLRAFTQRHPDHFTHLPFLQGLEDEYHFLPDLFRGMGPRITKMTILFSVGLPW